VIADAAERYIPGMRIELRDAEWRIDRVDVPSHGGYLLTCTGHNELVRGKTGTFLTELESGTRILTPETTELTDDLSRGYAATQLKLHALLETSPPADSRIHLGHQAAIDPMPYQLEPAIQALEQTRPRILIADAVGLGKTISAGILTTELIRRGRGKRILVLGVKSMLGQLQQEFWQRFTIPLTRLDSIGLQRIRNTIPTNHNPFHHIDRAIISIDTLKQSLEYRDYLEHCHWDIVIIDEAHNVARRSTQSLRYRLADLLCTRCDALIMLSATPHDGKPESFASLMRMLDPTVIPNQSDYEKDDFSNRGLVIRRFKKDVADQLTNLPEREVFSPTINATDAENHAFATVRSSQFKTLNKQSTGAGQLFRTTLEKALLSSPAACLSTVSNRLKKLDTALQSGKADDVRRAAIQADIETLESITLAVKSIEPATFSKFQMLVDMLSNRGEYALNWNSKDPDDRIVLFTESVVTLKFLEEHLPAALRLKNTGTTRRYAVLHGLLKDVELMDTVNEFNRKDAPLRLLLCSDVASAGLNLHHCSHRLIHFDIPWSLLIFQQRNGRVDRYGQTQTPQIHYLQAVAQEEGVRGDQRGLEILVEKDAMASRNLGDPSEFQTGASVEEQEAQTAALMESNTEADDVLAMLDALVQNKEDAVTRFLQPTEAAGRTLEEMAATDGRVYATPRAFLAAGLAWLSETRTRGELVWEQRPHEIVLDAPADLQALTRRLPREAMPKDYRFVLSDDVKAIQADMALARNDEEASFGQLQYLWPQHPVLGWLRTRVADAFGRHTAPVVRLPERLGEDEHWFLAHGGFPNRRGQALIQDQVAVQFQNGVVSDLLPMTDFLTRLQIDGSPIANRSEARDCTELAQYLNQVVTFIRQHLQAARATLMAERESQVAQALQGLQALRAQHTQQLEIELSRGVESSDSSVSLNTRRERRRREREQQIERHFRDYERWLDESVQTEDEPYIQIVAVFTGNVSERLS